MNLRISPPWEAIAAATHSNQVSSVSMTCVSSRAFESAVKKNLAGRAGARGEIRRAQIVGAKGDEAAVDCALTLVVGLPDKSYRRVTLQASAKASEQGQTTDRLMRLAAEACGASLAPDIDAAIATLKQ